MIADARWQPSGGTNSSGNPDREGNQWRGGTNMNSSGGLGREGIQWRSNQMATQVGTNQMATHGVIGGRTSPVSIPRENGNLVGGIITEGEQGLRTW